MNSAALVMAAVVIISGGHGKPNRTPPWEAYQCRHWSEGHFECQRATVEEPAKLPCVDTFKELRGNRLWYCKGLGIVSPEEADQLNRSVE